MANSVNNPHKGTVIYEEGGDDVYHGVPKDFVGKEVTPENFLAVLRGDETLAKAGKRVVNSGPNDRIFAFFADHGAPGYVSFPHSVLHATDLNKELIQMHKDKRYSTLVFYLSACESGTMFEKLLPADINAFAITATNTVESGWACNHEPKVYKTYLAGWFAVNWLNNTVTNDPNKETLEEQYEYIKIHNNFTMDGGQYSQHAQQYGDLTLANKDHIAQYQGDKKALANSVARPVTGFSPSRDVPINILKHQIESANDADEKQQYVAELNALLAGRQMLDKQIVQYVNSIADIPGVDVNVVLNEKLELNNFAGYRQLVDTFHEHCYNLGQNTYALGKMHAFVNIAEQLTESSAANLAVDRLRQFCAANVAANNALII
ncbi:unnamed protein product [Oppiella nova]|uniref:Legumain n=1 Tax=Oppiella nova TaxID=334625 RepID=A0A7R9MBX7_9ACAR|nr:unnamed protein product [Oppiella nova]CAG2174558.1 unnamed protein product [Oppiella nova]